MRHLGDITAIDGRTIEPVDVVTGGSPCQDLSIAGKRAGLAGERSGLYMEQIRIIREMREADKSRGRPDHLCRPRFMVWENVPGALSSNGGKDFQAVLHEAVKLIEPEAPVMPVPEKGWPNAGILYDEMGRWSLAWRIHDAKFWGVPQRRRRISLVVDFGGLAAPEVSFERKGLSWDSAPGGEAEQEAAAGAGGGAETAGGVICLNDQRGSAMETSVDVTGTLRAQEHGHQPIVCGGFKPHAGAEAGSIGYQMERPPTLDTGKPMAVICIQGNVIDRDAKMNGLGIAEEPMFTLNTVDRHGVCAPKGSLHENHGQDSRITGPLEVAPTISQKYGTGGNNTPLVMASGQAGAEIMVDKSPTLNCDHEQPIFVPAVGHTLKAKGNLQFREDSETYVVTGVDCRNGTETEEVSTPLQRGGTGVSLNAINPIRTGVVVRRLTVTECERLQGFPDGWTDIGAWTDSAGKLHKESSDSARYKALGNSIALPYWAWLSKRISAQYERTATLGSLFDGIGGFPLVWERVNGSGSCRWASEIEPFCIKVTKYRFGEG